MLDKFRTWVYNHISELELLTFLVLLVTGLYVIYITS